MDCKGCIWSQDYIVLSWSTLLIDDCTNSKPMNSLSGDSLLFMIHTVGLGLSVYRWPITRVGYDFWTLLPRGSCVSSLTVCERVIFEQKLQIFSSQNCCLVPKARKVWKKSQKIGMFRKPKCPQKDKVFEKVWRLKKIKKYLKLSKYFKKLESIWKLY